MVTVTASVGRADFEGNGHAKVLFGQKREFNFGFCETGGLADVTCSYPEQY